MTVAVNVGQGSDGFNAFDVRVVTDPGVLNPSSVDLTGSLLLVNSMTLKAECINGSGFGCVAPLDGPGVVRVNVNVTGAALSPPNGRLFAVTFQIVGLSTDTTVGFSTHLFTRIPSCFEGVCTSGTGANRVPGVFSNLTPVVSGYMVTVTPLFTFNATTRTLSGTFATTVANDTDGTILFSKTFNISLKVGQGSDAPFILGAPVLPVALGVALDINTGASSITGFVSGNPDVLGRGVVDILDIATIAFAFGSSQGSPRYNLAYDLNQDGTINIVDVAQAATDFRIPVFY